MTILHTKQNHIQPTVTDQTVVNCLSCPRTSITTISNPRHTSLTSITRVESILQHVRVLFQHWLLSIFPNTSLKESVASCYHTS